MFNFKNHVFSAFDRKIWLSSPTMHGDELKYMFEAYETNRMSTVGVNIDETEKSMAQKLGVRYAVSLSSERQLFILQ